MNLYAITMAVGIAALIVAFLILHYTDAEIVSMIFEAAGVSLLAGALVVMGVEHFFGVLPA